MESIGAFQALNIAIVCGQGNEIPEAAASARALALQLAMLGHHPTLIDLRQMAFDAIEWPAYQLCHVATPDDGTFHRRLQGRSIPHTGSSAEAVELTASRTGARQYLLRFDVPTPAFVMLRNCVSALDAVARVASLGYPLLVRPDNRHLGGNRLVRNADELTECVQSLFRDTDRVMCERCLSGRAFSVFLQGENVLPPVASNVVLTERTSTLDHSLTTADRHRLEHVASMAGVALGVSGLVQVDTVLDDYGRVWVLEVNPQPCLTENGAAHRAAAQVGLSYADLCQWMVQDCLLAESLR